MFDQIRPVIASPCEIKDNAYGRTEPKYILPKIMWDNCYTLFHRGVAISVSKVLLNCHCEPLPLARAWQSRSHGKRDCWAPFSRSTLRIWCRIRSIHATRCVATLLAM